MTETQIQKRQEAEVDAIARIEEIGRQIVLRTHLVETGEAAQRQLAMIDSLRAERDRLHNYIAYR